MAREDEYQSPQNPKHTTKESIRIENVENKDSFLSPRFLSAAAMAGWDEEALLLASLVVEDTPERESKHKKRPSLQFKTPPPTNSRRKRRSPQQNLPSIPVIGVINLDHAETSLEDGAEKKVAEAVMIEEKKKQEGDDESMPAEAGISCSGSTILCMDRLREELSCAICLEICFEPSTTSCGHSFCKKCLKSAADKCGKRCPKCRQLISNGRSCTVNTVLWNTIQLLFPEEVEAKKVAAAARHNQETKNRSPKNGGNNIRHSNLDSSTTNSNSSRRRTRWSTNQENAASTFQSNSDRRRRVRLGQNEEEDAASAFPSNTGRRRMRWGPSQEEDAALAFQLQREEFMEAFRGAHEHEQPSSSFVTARANLRAMASRAIHLRVRGRPT
ncbi:putative E3 ubiquitin-protein ligase RING1a [Magnolia sinica]|uniref:putative E3 ubiquitin-protein ligase RING1a n=1 Tax=Magnolia sinica TaxID=86752 RepID=UPI00265942B2|nr:putative E3 ubiquitin-protein ligase RING1a [Magnolia sinica]